MTPVNDTVVESNETVVATLSASAAYTVGTPSSGTVTIVSDDVALPTVTLAATTGTATEAGPVAGRVHGDADGEHGGGAGGELHGGRDGDGGERLHGAVGERDDRGGAGERDDRGDAANDTVVEGDETVVVTLSASAALHGGGAEQRRR